MPKNDREYKLLTADQQTNIITQRQLQFEADHFNHSLTIQALETEMALLPDTATDEDRQPFIDQIAYAEKSMDTIAKAIDALDVAAEAVAKAEAARADDAAVDAARKKR